jgi:hypothetical protein
MQLTLQNQLRTETDAERIANLKRKGWVETTPPAHNAETHHAPEWINGQWVAAALTADELAARARKTWPTAAAFLDEFSMPELAEISLSTDPTTAALRLLILSWGGDVWSDDPRISAGLDQLVSVGIISQSRREEIVSKN